MTRPSQRTVGAHERCASHLSSTGDGLALPEGTGWDEAVFLAGVAAVPVDGGPLVVLLQKTFEDERRRIADVANAAREVVDDDETFVRRLEQDGRLRDMLREALEAGARTSNEAKRRRLEV